MKRRLLAGLVAFLFTLRAFAEGLPDLGDSAQADLSPQMERQIGAAIIREIRSDARYVDDPEIEDYLDRIGSRLVAVSATPSQPYHYYVLQDKSINAAATLGGVLYFHTGLFVAAQSESELASVMAHEISHVQQRHMARMLSQQQNLGYMMMASLVLAILASRSSGNAAGATVMAGQAAMASAQLAYSRDFEREADRIGLQALDAAGFDTREMVSFFERLDRATRLFDSGAFAYLRSHPLTTERISDIANRVQQTPYRQVVDSIDFSLVKAKIESLEQVPQDTLLRYSGEPPQRTNAAAIHWYSRARAHLKLNQVADAQADLAALRRIGLESPMIELLDADVARAASANDAAVKTLRAARVRFPQSRALVYGEIDALLAGGHPKEAAASAMDQLRFDLADDRIYSRLAKANAALGKRLAQHRAQAEVYYLHGAIDSAIEQLSLGLRARDGDQYEKAAAEARLAEFQDRRRELERDRRR
ncbi:M48 family metalloprotease [Niveibacterium umoris]|uniref:Putative Zn-dependent protease n=1 Tax=Niveibacterium umoris TaxID=1193620 RepID=A0A840BLL8_9RHOO|nr:M48 family metalloprotease [Niveibacterium umoris]MBB4012429.1 putative Zn-dependent protease [Niveibacterium umoris]